MPRRVHIEDIEEDEPGEADRREADRREAERRPRRVEIEEEEAETPDEIPILWRKDLQLWTIADSNVVFSPELCMVIGFVFRSVLIRAPSKEVKQVCDAYKVIYLDPEKYFI